MEGIKDFLEASTIHGLGYISTSKSYFTKCLWIFIVGGGFCTAGILIKGAFTSWKESPITTSMETFPINDVAFPLVTVCPPEDSNTALNSDIVNADKIW